MCASRSRNGRHEKDRKKLVSYTIGRSVLTQSSQGARLVLIPASAAQSTPSESFAGTSISGVARSKLETGSKQRITDFASRALPLRSGGPEPSQRMENVCGGTPLSRRLVRRHNEMKPSPNASQNRVEECGRKNQCRFQGTSGRVVDSSKVQRRYNCA